MLDTNDWWFNKICWVASYSSEIRSNLGAGCRTDERLYSVSTDKYTATCTLLVSKSVVHALQLCGQTDVYVPSTVSRHFGAETKMAVSTPPTPNYTHLFPPTSPPPSPSSLSPSPHLLPPPTHRPLIPIPLSPPPHPHSLTISTAYILLHCLNT